MRITSGARLVIKSTRVTSVVLFAVGDVLCCDIAADNAVENYTGKHYVTSLSLHRTYWLQTLFIHFLIQYTCSIQVKTHNRIESVILYRYAVRTCGAEIK